MSGIFSKFGDAIESVRDVATVIATGVEDPSKPRRNPYDYKFLHQRDNMPETMQKLLKECFHVQAAAKISEEEIRRDFRALLDADESDSETKEYLTDFFHQILDYTIWARKQTEALSPAQVFRIHYKNVLDEDYLALSPEDRHAKVDLQMKNLHLTTQDIDALPALKERNEEKLAHSRLQEVFEKYMRSKVESK